MTTKIAAVTDDRQTICPHFGRAAFYAVFTVDEREITDREFRRKVGHRDFAGSHDHHMHHHDEPLGADRGGGDASGGTAYRGPVAADHNRADRGQAADDNRGHADADHDAKHALMVDAIADCEVVLVGGMGAGARRAFADAGIRPVAAAAVKIEEAVRAYLTGTAHAEPDCCR